MIDIIPPTQPGKDASIVNTQVPRAANLFAVQVGNLEYLPNWGVDLNYFLTEGLEFQNESFKSYLVKQLSANGINTTSVIDTVEDFIETMTFNLTPEDTSTGMLAR